MSGDYGSMRGNEFHDDPYQDPARYDAELNKVRGSVATMSNHVSRLELLFREMNDDASSGRVSEVLGMKNQIQEVMERCKQQLMRLNSYRVQDRGLRIKADRIRREFETTARKFQDLAQALLQTMRTASATGGESELLVDVDDSQQLTRQQQVHAEADLAATVENEQEMARLADEIVTMEEMFRDLHDGVMQQADGVESISNNVNQAYDNVESGERELAAAVAHKRAVRKRCIIIVVIVIVILAIVGLVIGLSVRRN